MLHAAPSIGSSALARRDPDVRSDSAGRFAAGRGTGGGCVCPGCGAPMIEIGCKIRCGACGYFEDCGGGLTPPPVDAHGS